MICLHVYREFHPQASGVARHIDGLLRALTAAGEGGRVFAPSLAPDAAAAPFPVLSGGLRSLWRAVRAATVVHVHGARVPIALVAAVFATLAGKPFFYTPHCYYESRSLWRRLLKRLWDRTAERWLLRAARTVVLLDPVWSAYLEARGLPPRATLHLPNCVLRAGLEARRRPRRPSRGGRPMLLSVGRLDTVKRLKDAVALLARPELARAELHIVGDGPEQGRLAALAAGIGVSARVHWHGKAPDAAVAELFAEADAFVLPSEREGGPTVLLEALWLGVPVIAARATGTEAMAAALGWTGLVPVGDVAAAARLALAPPPVTPEVRDRLDRHFTWEARIGDLLRCYRAAAPIKIREKPDGTFTPA